MEKKYEISNAFHLNKMVRHSGLRDVIAEGTNEMQVSDGYHTMDELYEHRIALWIVLCHSVWAMSLASKSMGRDDVVIPVWKTKTHSDGSKFEGWFVLGLNTEKGKQITYHIPESKWDECDFAEELLMAPEYDGHTSADVLKRLSNI